MVRGFTAAIIVWAFCSSWLSTAATLYLFFVILNSRYLSLLYPPQTSGSFSCSLDRKIMINRTGSQVQHTWLLLFAFFVVIKTCESERIVIWRDQCEEHDYRRLLCLLQQLERGEEDVL